MKRSYLACVVMVTVCALGAQFATGALGQEFTTGALAGDGYSQEAVSAGERAMVNTRLGRPHKKRCGRRHHPGHGHGHGHGHSKRHSKRCTPLPSSAGAARGDFNGDNFADLAIGLPGEDVGNHSDAGAVLIIFGSSSGLTSSADPTVPRPAPVLLHQDTPGVLDATETGDKFGAALAAGDFNHDGRTDLAVAVPGESSAIAGSTATAKGAIHLFMGSGSSEGLPAFDQVITGASLPTSSGTIPILGDSLAWADFDDDGFPDLAVETQGVGGVAFTILFGGQGVFGLVADRRATRVTGLTTSTAPSPITLAAGDMNGGGDGGVDDLIVGAPSTGADGKVAWFRGTTSRTTTLTQGTSIVADLPDTSFGRLGSSVALGDADADGLMDLAVGNSEKSTFDSTVEVFHGTVNGLESDGFAGRFTFAKQGFGPSVVFADFDGNGFDDLAIGAAGADLGSLADSGAVTVCPGANIPGLFQSSSCVRWTQDSSGIEGKAEAGDRFGEALSAWNFGKNAGETAQADLAITVPGEDSGSGASAIVDAGTVNVIYGTSAGLSSSGDQLWDQGVSGVPGGLEFADGLGMSLY